MSAQRLASEGLDLISGDLNASRRNAVDEAEETPEEVSLFQLVKGFFIGRAVFHKRRAEEENAVNFMQQNESKMTEEEIGDLRSAFGSAASARRQRLAAKRKRNMSSKISWTWVYEARVQTMADRLHLTQDRMIERGFGASKNPTRSNDKPPEKVDETSQDESRVRRASRPALSLSLAGMSLKIADLSKHTLHWATYDDPGAFSRCSIMDRREALLFLYDWLGNVERDKSIVWVKGGAGVGKTCLIREFAAACAAKNSLAASFFGSKDQEAFSVIRGFTATIAHGIANHIPAFGPLANAVCAEKEWVVRKSIYPTQTNELILNPWLQLDSSDHRPLLMVLDGIDHCGDFLASQIVEFMGLCVRHLPVCFVFSSAEEARLSKALQASHLGDKVVSLEVEAIGSG